MAILMVEKKAIQILDPDVHKNDIISYQNINFIFICILTQDFLIVEFAFKCGMWNLIRDE